MFKKILIANRGEIALRILRACREIGIKTVAAHSTADAEAMHVRLADESVCIGPPPSNQSYLNIPSILSAATIAGVDAIHPGIGFLSENANFADIVREHGMAFIGPESHHIRLMGDKVAARLAVKKLGLDIVPGSDEPLSDWKNAHHQADSIGYPILLKAAGGGGGRGMRVVRQSDDLESSYQKVRAEAELAFGDPRIFVEAYIRGGRHIEVQLLGDGRGKAVHLGVRDCSLQRSYQKLWEEAPSPGLSQSAYDHVVTIACKAIAEINYWGVGTLEFLYYQDQFFFLEMNTRLQVEHTLSEMITGMDIVREQISLACGSKLSLSQEEILFAGHAIECRINAEAAWTRRPSPGRVGNYHAPGGLGVRVDSSLYRGCAVPPYYDSLVAKLIVHGRDRHECLMKLRGALDEFVIEGIETTIPLYQVLVRDPDILDGRYDSTWLDHFLTQHSSS